MTVVDSGAATNGSTAARLRLGTAPDSWGVWFADDPAQTPWQRFLDEVVTAGYEWVELGPYGYLPTDSYQLAEELSQRGLKVAGGTVAGASGLHRVDEWQSVLDATRKVARLTSALGARDLVFVPVPGYRDDNTGAYLEPAELDADDWQTLVRSTNELGKIIGQEYGVRLHFHEHADSHVETQPQIERFLDDTDPRYTWLCLDTGHIAYRAGDSVALVRKYPERIGYVHIKQVDPEIARVAGDEGIPFGQAVKRGVCVEPPSGAPPVGAVVDALGKLDRALFVVVEQDLYPCAFDVPLPIAVRTRDYLRGFGLGVDGRPVARAGKEVER
jgi:inosose dehydratase